MNLNLANIPAAIAYFVIGAFFNLLIFYIFSPTKVGMINLLNSVFQLSTTTTGIVWLGIMSLGILANILYPIWTIMDTEQ